ncbi:MAG: DEAD/DEAH box helicase [Burkholderiales bacterium]|nr:DEAD/DEAH box helicase [Burkholderiales bacterium]
MSEHNQTFAELGISPAMVEMLNKKGFEEPSKIQALVIPEFLKQKSNIIGQAQTGTGKTAAFAIPILETLIPDNGITKALILTPTRELANQVSDEIYSLISNKTLKVYPVYGGQSIEQQIKNIRRGADIIVGTPGRIIDLLERNVLDLTNLEYFVLDEADEMLNMGFVDAIEEILQQTNQQQKMLFFSATMPSSILKIAKKYMNEFKILKVENVEATTDLTEQIYFEIRESEKFDTLCRVLDFEREFYGIIFARTKHETDDITQRLKSRGYLVDSLHGDINQANRNKTLAAFKSKQINILIATDVAARGIDVNNLTHVINYSVPQEAESYVHRIGRTGRAGNKGVAITFITRKDAYQLTRIQKMTKTNIKRQLAPTVNEVINAKKETLEACVNEIINENDYAEYMELAKTILASNNPEIVTAALLRHAYGDDFLPQSYASEYTNNSGHDASNKRFDYSEKLDDQTRLFVALGKRDGYTPKKLLELLHTQCKTPARKVRDVRILDNFSFISVPFDEAEIILRTINTEERKKPLITRAKKK